jgi:cation transport ATPase
MPRPESARARRLRRRRETRAREQQTRRSSRRSRRTRREAMRITAASIALVLVSTASTLVASSYWMTSQCEAVCTSNCYEGCGWPVYLVFPTPLIIALAIPFALFAIRSAGVRKGFARAVLILLLVTGIGFVHPFAALLGLADPAYFEVSGAVRSSGVGATIRLSLLLAPLPVLAAFAWGYLRAGR